MSVKSFILLIKRIFFDCKSVKLFRNRLLIYIYIMTKIEVFRIEPEVGEKCYEYAESTTTEGKWPDEKHFTNIEPLYVGRFIKSEIGGRGDGGWRRDYFQDNKGTEHVVNYSYEGKTCFREVPCISCISSCNR